MLNQVAIVGRLIDQPLEDRITLACPRSYKNEEGIYETDFITCRIMKGISDNVKEYCKKGDVVGIRGRIQTADGLEIIAEKVTFLSSNKNE